MSNIVTSSSSSSMSSYRDFDSVSLPSPFDEQSSSSIICSYLESASSTPIPFEAQSLSPSSASALHKVDSCRASIHSSLPHLRIDVGDDMDENSDPNWLSAVQDPELGKIVEAVNAQSPLFRVALLSREKQLNEVFIIHQVVDDLAVALFKPEETSSGSDRKLGLTGSIRDAMRNEIIAYKLAGKLTRTFILPTAEATSLRIGLASKIEMVNDDSASSPVGALVQGTLHKFVGKTKALKDCGQQAINFFSSTVLAVKQRTQLIAALHILTVYLDGNAGNLLLDEAGFPVAIDFAEILPSRFRIGARPPCWLQASACREPFDAAVLKEIAQLKWSELEEVLAKKPDFSAEKIATLYLSFTLLQKGAKKKLTASHLVSFIIGERPLGVFEKEFRAPPAMHLIYNACVQQGKVDTKKLDETLGFAMEFVVQTMAKTKLLLTGEALYTYQERIAKSLRSQLDVALS